MPIRHYAWSAINTFGNTIISFVGNVILARMLSPDDYGLIAMLAIFMAIGMNFTDSGLSDYLINKKDADEEDYATMRTHNIATSALFFGIFYLGAPSIAQFYGRVELEQILRILAFGIVFKAFSLSEIARLRKQLKFERLAIILTGANVASLLVAYLFALQGAGYWALVVQVLLQSFSVAILSYVATRKTPSLAFSKAKYYEMRRFGNNMLLSYVTNQFGDNIATVIIGKMYSAPSLGAYSQARRIGSTFFTAINSVVLTTSYPLIARESVRSRRRKKYSDTLSVFFFAHCAVLFPLVATAPDLIVVVFGYKWIDVAPFLQLVLISVLLQPLVTVNSNIAKTEGKTHIYRNLTFFRNFLSLGFLLISARYSIAAIIIGQAAAKYISAITDVANCGKLVGLSLRKQVGIAIRGAIAPLIAAVVAQWAAAVGNTHFERLLWFIPIYSLVFMLIGIATFNSNLLILLKALKFRLG